MSYAQAGMFGAMGRGIRGIGQMIVRNRQKEEEDRRRQEALDYQRAAQLAAETAARVAKAHDLSVQKPEILAALTEAYERYAKDVNLIEVPDDYNPLTQVQKNVERNKAKEMTDKVPLTWE